MKQIMDYLYRKPAKKESDQTDEFKENKMILEQIGLAEKDKNERKLKIKRPIIWICNNLYSRGLKLLREQSFVFNFYRNNDSVSSRLKEICTIEKICTNDETLRQLACLYDSDMRAC